LLAEDIFVRQNLDFCVQTLYLVYGMSIGCVRVGGHQSPSPLHPQAQTNTPFFRSLGKGDISTLLRHTLRAKPGKRWHRLRIVVICMAANSHSPRPPLVALAPYRCDLPEWPSSWMGDDAPIRILRPARNWWSASRHSFFILPNPDCKKRPSRNTSTTCGCSAARSFAIFRKLQSSGRSRSPI